MQTDLFLKQLTMLTNEARILETEALRVVESTPGSPRQVPSHGLRGNAVLGPSDLHSSAEPTGIRSIAGSSSRSRRGSQ